MKINHIENEFIAYIDDAICRDIVDLSDIIAASKDPILAQEWWSFFAENTDQGEWAQKQLEKYLNRHS